MYIPYAYTLQKSFLDSVSHDGEDDVVVVFGCDAVWTRM